MWLEWSPYFIVQKRQDEADKWQVGQLMEWLRKWEMGMRLEMWKINTEVQVVIEASNRVRLASQCAALILMENFILLVLLPPGRSRAHPHTYQIL